MNWRWVNSSAASGMLLTMPISIAPSLREGSAGAHRTPLSRLKLRPDAPCSSTTGIAVTPNVSGRSFRRDDCPMRGLRCRKRLIEILHDVVYMLDADAEPDHLRPHTGHRLLPTSGDGSA